MRGLRAVRLLTFIVPVLVLAALAASAPPASAQTLKAVQQRGSLLCGVSHGLEGFSSQDAKGNWAGFDVDFCRALAAAIFDDPAKVSYVQLTASDRFEALRSNKIDVLSRNSTWTMGRETELGLMFAGVTYYDGQGFLVARSKNVNSALELDNAVVCLQTGTTGEANLADYFNSNNMHYQLMAFPTSEEAIKAYDSGRCGVFTTDTSQLYAIRLTLSHPDEHVILPDVISKEPLGPAVRQGDDQWLNIVKWTNFAMINAEELGVGSATLAQALTSTKPDVRRLLGNEGSYGEQLGLTKDWAARIIRHVGNYGEVFDRNVGSGSPLGIPRGLNHLWNLGGILYAPPIK